MYPIEPEQYRKLTLPRTRTQSNVQAIILPILQVVKRKSFLDTSIVLSHDCMSVCVCAVVLFSSLKLRGKLPKHFGK